MFYSTKQLKKCLKKIGWFIGLYAISIIFVGAFIFGMRLLLSFVS